MLLLLPELRKGQAFVLCVSFRYNISLGLRLGSLGIFRGPKLMVMWIFRTHVQLLCALG